MDRNLTSEAMWREKLEQERWLVTVSVRKGDRLIADSSFEELARRAFTPPRQKKEPNGRLEAVGPGGISIGARDADSLLIRVRRAAECLEDGRAVIVHDVSRGSPVGAGRLALQA